jgi:rod shape-determining protein MreD
MPQIRLLGGMPDLVFLIVLSWSINTRLEDGVIWSFVGGILYDLLSGAPTGTAALGMLFVVFGISGIGQQVYSIGFLLLAGAVIVGTIFKQLILYFVLTLSGFEVEWLVMIGYVLVPTLIYNIALIAPVYWFIRGIQKRVIRAKGGFTT